MGFWSNLYQWAMTPVNKAAAPVPAWHAATVEVERWGYEDAGLQEFADIYRKLTWVQLAISTVARTAAGAQLEVLRLSGEERNKIENHPFELLMQRPNPSMSRFEFLEAHFASRRLTGNAYWWLNRPNPTAPPSEIWLVPSHRMRPVPDGRMGVRGYLYDPGDGKEIPLEAWEIVHFKLFNPTSSLVGLSPMESLRYVNQGDLAMQRWNTNYFDKDNAKPAGALAFAEPIADPEWDRMKAEVKREHGGTRRSLMMLRNVGAGGVQWVSMAMSQADMQFLEGRTFNKEEILALYAPGLASVLAVNATEANALAGKKTLLEFGVWPDLVATSEKITNDLLPAFGPQLVAAFVDIRETDRAMRLQEQAAFERVHTVDEIRAEFYQSPPLGDERGKLLLAEVGKTLLGGADDPAPMPPPLLPMPDMPDTPDPEDDPEDDTPDTPPAKGQHVHIHVHTDAAKAEAATAQDFFPLTLPAGPITPDAYKALVLQLDPDDDEAEQRIRWQVERRTRRAIEAAMDDILREISAQVPTTAEATVTQAQRYFERDRALYDALARALQDSADLGVNVAFDQMDNIGLAFDWTLAQTQARDWALQYTADLVRGIEQTTVTGVRQSVSRWITNGEPLDALVADLRPLFGTRRAELIASTEVTRAYAEGARVAYRTSGVVNEIEWRAARDERACPVCGARHGRRAGLNTPQVDGVGIPAHPRCRCWWTPVIPEPED